MVQTEKKLWEYTGTVTAVNDFGIKLDAWEDGREWINFTKAEWRDSPFDEPHKGDIVQITCSQDARGKLYIKTISRQSGAPQEPGPWEKRDEARSESILRQVCLKCASELIAARIQTDPQAYQDTAEGPATGLIYVDVLALAQEFERWGNRE